MGAERDPHCAVRALEVGDDEVHRGRSDELGDEQVARPVVELVRGRDLLEEAVPHHDHAVAHRHRLGLVVRDVDRRDSQVALEPRDLGTHLHPQLRVEVGERLVHEKRLGVADDRPTHRHALPLAAGERARLLVQRVFETEDAGRLAHPSLDLVLRETAHLQRKAHVPRRVHVRVERVVLEHHGDVAVLRRQVVDHLAVERHLART